MPGEHRMPHWKRLYEEFSEQIASGALRPGERLPSENELALLHKVSRLTVHRAMRELQQQGLVVRRTRAGTAVAERTAKLGTLAVLIYNASVYPQANYLAGIGQALAPESRLWLMDTRDDAQEEGRLAASLAGVADAVIAYSTGAPELERIYQRLEAAGTAIVFVDRVPAFDRSFAVVGNDAEASRAVVAKMVADGHRRLLHLTDIEAVSTVRERARGFETALLEAGIDPVGATLAFDFRDHVWFDQISVALTDALRPHFETHSPPTALFCAHDQLMAGAMAAIARLEVPPGRVQIASFNDYPRLPVEGLDRIHRIVPATTAMGAAAVRLAGSLRSQPETEPHQIVLPARVEWAEPPGGSPDKISHPPVSNGGNAS